MVSYGLFSISLKRARIRSAVVSRGDICNSRNPFTLVSSTKYIAEPSIPPYTGCQHQQPPDRGYHTKKGPADGRMPAPRITPSWAPDGARRIVRIAPGIEKGRSPSPLQGSRPFFVTLLGRWTRLRLGRSVDPGVHPLQDAAAVLVLGLVIPQALDLFRAQRLDPVGHLIGA